MAANEIKAKNLYSLNMKNGCLYETIITTQNLKGEYNAAPMGVVCKNQDEVVLYLYEGTKTLNNIQNTSTFAVNITQDPLIFTETILGDVSPDLFEDYKSFPVLKNVDGFFLVKNIAKKDVVRKDHLGESHLFIITAQVQEIVKNREYVIPLNRGIYAVIESLVHYTRIDMVDDEKQFIYWRRIKEMNRVAQKVGSSDDKKSMQRIIGAIKEKVGDLDEKFKERIN